jgi:hypothetical protein
MLLVLLLVIVSVPVVVRSLHMKLKHNLTSHLLPAIQHQELNEATSKSLSMCTTALNAVVLLSVQSKGKST